ncbi:MAG: crotonase/enoyl-CoA hydratase family protein [Candidatus Nanopelagicales bacterium]
MSELVTVDLDGHVLMIGINRPEKLNSFNLDTIDQFGAAYQRLAEDPAVRVGVIYGHGEHFSAGLDLAEVGPAVAQHGPQILSGNYDYDPYGMWKPQASKPVVVALSGYAYTLSIELALASDIVIAADNTRFRQLEIGRGIMPFGGATVRATAQLGWGNAMQFLLTAQEFDAAQALRIGLVQEVVPNGEQVARARELAQVIAKQAPLGVQGTLINARIARGQGHDAAVEHIGALLPELLASKDAAEGIRSFIERRDADFSGE